MYLGIDFIVEFLIGLVIGCMLWVKAQAYLADMDRYRQLIKQQQYWMSRDWLAQKLHEEAAYEQRTRR